MRLDQIPKDELKILANKVGRKWFTLYRIGKGHVIPGAKLCIAIEQHTKGKIKRSDLRPDLWR